ncbi:hypothetical protein B0H21DRAFT_711366 [Amylocystis lapponica]|nr:hypothetical protein B0H21DRAFT_711366 [Amylocystis lapponica]
MTCALRSTIAPRLWVLMIWIQQLSLDLLKAIPIVLLGDIEVGLDAPAWCAALDSTNTRSAARVKVDDDGLRLVIQDGIGRVDEPEIMSISSKRSNFRQRLSRLVRLLTQQTWARYPHSGGKSENIPE